ncbi:uncharacterized protein LOC134194179 [Corticium candelabrum]|uniref:uncharacterized protein LOC134194179 n=1 Tax=Corticium candelabrum TaxID=121492 RepID=UPI002E25D58A|nr:uncharacterized protein LOC134194179 [Corticium candelabrum]XP_062519075.1 uncharacterized protein LOC134194179 [Corticium candelabrum]XP_062519076.1 uncharacterized protein LOC134194179 [Corticium candelabrum]XP_062519077.1 uncharacterized protein LOC134194179 [Corticium candelabrum]XP_062519078.1 uncharacterized protein LOC134194179 [Corticium candelabrum]XP_062519079.1 uncharacterized protein LOC134194179 [Corticium candelabrum]XP_062519080.1 uncharacterized protein LOC134194179 [Cortic
MARGMADRRADVPSEYDLVVDIETFEQLTNGNPGWEVRCPEILRRLGQAQTTSSQPKKYVDGMANQHSKRTEDASARTDGNPASSKQSEDVDAEPLSTCQTQEMNEKSTERKTESSTEISQTSSNDETDKELTGAAVVAHSLHQELKAWKLKSDSRSLTSLVSSAGPEASVNTWNGENGLSSSLTCNLIKPLNTSDWVSSTEDTATMVGEPLHLQYDSQKGATIFIAVVGLYNKGKTYVLNRIGKTNLPEGAGCRTTGISMKTGNGNILSRFTLLDIAGFDAPVRVGQDRSAVYYKKYVDRFIEELALNLATAVVVVMNNITLTDQLYLEHVRKAMHSFKIDYAAASGISERIPEEKFPDLIVIHNFSSYGNLEECKKAFRGQIEENYEGKWLDYDRKQKFYYTEGVPGQMVGI